MRSADNELIMAKMVLYNVGCFIKRHHDGGKLDWQSTGTFFVALDDLGEPILRAGVDTFLHVLCDLLHRPFESRSCYISGQNIDHVTGFTEPIQKTKTYWRTPSGSILWCPRHMLLEPWQHFTLATDIPSLVIVLRFRGPANKVCKCICVVECTCQYVSVPL